MNPGDRLGPYEIVASLGSGGMGEVYKARDTRLGRIVAVKVLPERHAENPAMRERFEREARAISALAHPAICTLHDVGEHEGTHFLVMECLEGETLAARLARGPMPVEQVLEVGTEIARALGAAHASGVVHRDLKPGNVMLTKTGAKLLDFGLAKLHAASQGIVGPLAQETASAPLTEQGTITGTLQYMAPEQLVGLEADARSDIFALGCVLYEMASGRKAFGGETQAGVIGAILHEEPAPLASVGPSVPPGLDRLVRACLAKDREARWHSASDLAQELAWIQATRTVENVAPPAGRRRSVWVPWAVAAAAVVIAAGAALRPGLHRGGALGSLPDWTSGTLTPLTTDPGYQAEPTFSPDGETIAYVSDRDGNYEIYLQQVSGGPAINLTRSPAADIQPAFSPDGRQIAFVSDRAGGNDVYVVAPSLPLVGGDIWVMPALGGAARRIAGPGNFPSWSPDGRTIVYAHGTFRYSHLAVVPAEGGASKDVEIAGLPEVRFFYPSYSSDGRWLLLQNGDTVCVVPAGGGEGRELVGGERPVWGPGSRSIVFTSRERGKSRTLWQVGFDLGTGRLVGAPRPVTFGRGPDTGAALSRDGRSLVFTALDESLNLERLPFDAEAGRPTGPPLRLTEGNNQVSFLDASPDGRAVVFAAARGGASHIWRVDPPAAPVQLTLDPRFSDTDPHWSPDGQTIAFRRSGETDAISAELWTMAPDGAGPRRVAEGVGEISWTDGRRILAQQGGIEDLVLLDLATGSRRPLAGVKARSLFTVDPSGEWLAFQVSEQGHASIAAARLAGDPQRPAIRTGNEVYHPSFSPGGRWLYFQRHHKNLYRVPGPAQQWRTAERQRVTDFSESGLYLDYPQISRDGKALFYTRGLRTGNLWLLRLGPPSTGGGR
ncbi:MAG TPA: protein kinase [Thermoanaerobaculaceae bacterium]|nr:protein kinase [Thermoanaerobaculaceae bacterium]